MSATLRRRYGHAAKLPDAQIDALSKFAQAGGHGFGEHAYLSRPTAMSLYLKGLIEVGEAGSDYRYPAGAITQAGLDALNAHEERRGIAYRYKAENTSLTHKPYAWSKWEVWTDAVNAAERRWARKQGGHP